MIYADRFDPLTMEIADIDTAEDARRFEQSSVVSEILRDGDEDDQSVMADLLESLGHRFPPSVEDMATTTRRVVR